MTISLIEMEDIPFCAPYLLTFHFSTAGDFDRHPISMDGMFNIKSKVCEMT